MATEVDEVHEEMQETLLPIEMLENLEVGSNDIRLTILAGNVHIEDRDSLRKIELDDEVEFIVKAKVTKAEVQRKNRGRRDAGRKFTTLIVVAKADEASIKKIAPRLSSVKE